MQLGRWRHDSTLSPDRRSSIGCRRRQWLPSREQAWRGAKPSRQDSKRLQKGSYLTDENLACEQVPEGRSILICKTILYKLRQFNTAFRVQGRHISFRISDIQAFRDGITVFHGFAQFFNFSIL